MAYVLNVRHISGGNPRLTGAMDVSKGEVNMLNRTRTLAGLTLLPAVLMLSASSRAAPILLVTPVFETPDAPAGDQYAAGGAVGWLGFNGVFIPRATAETGS